MKNLMFLASCLLSVSLCFAASFTSSQSSCSAPKNVSKVAETANSISFDWQDEGSSSYIVYYVKDGQASTTYQISTSNFTFTDLQAGAYTFHFSSNCGSVLSDEIIITDLIEQ